MKKFLKSALILLLVAAMAFSMIGCKKEEAKQQNLGADIKFPLEETLTFTAMLTGTETPEFKSQVANNTTYKKLLAETNVAFDYLFLGEKADGKMALLAQSKDYGDFFFGSTYFTSEEASKYIAAGVFVDLAGYVNEDVMPNFMEDIAENPSIISMISEPGGKIYSLPKVTGLRGHYLESPIHINKAWLDKLNLAVPTTLDELYNVLKAFKEKDPNGNGKADEIPYLGWTGSSNMHTEALMGAWGLATKDGTNDAYVQVVDGKVQFVPVQPAYKEAINYLGKLYKDGLMWKEWFTANNATANGYLTASECVVGMFTALNAPSTPYSGDYVVMDPPKVEGYTAKWYVHPAFNGSKNTFYVTDKCQNLGALMKYFDYFYNLDYAMGAEFNTPGEGRVELEEGKYKILSGIDTTALKAETPTLMELWGSGLCRSVTQRDYESKIILGATEKKKMSNWAQYEKFANKELWPRPYYSADAAADAGAYVTDILSLAQQNRAKWITAGGVTDAEWDAHVKQIEGMGLKAFIDILQEAYAGFLEAEQKAAKK